MTTPAPIAYLNPILSQINGQTVTYAPAVLAGVQAAELSDKSGSDKKQAVINAILAGSRAAEGVPNPNVAAIAGLIDLTVSILNSLGVFNRKPKAADASTVQSTK